jgi:hypothetical protein
MISIELTGKTPSLNDLINLNYRLHKINSSPPAIQISLPENAHVERVKEVEKTCQALEKYCLKDIGTKNQSVTNCWYIHNLFVFLLFNFDRNKLGVEPFNNSRFHLFTYLQVDSLEKFEDGHQPEKDELFKDFIRIARCQNKNYKVLPNDLENNATYMQTFENIYVASCVEGACMMVDSQGVASEFINEYKNVSFLARYLWIYLLVFLQRHTLIELTKRLMNIDSEAASDSKNSLRKLVSKLSKMKINSYFTDISDHTQHNTFYRFCSDRLMVKKYLDEVKDKIDGIDLILREQIEQTEKRRSRRLEWVLAILMIPQIYFAMAIFYQIEEHWFIKIIPVSFIILMLLLVWLIAADMFKNSKFKKNEHASN